MGELGGRGGGGNNQHILYEKVSIKGEENNRLS